MRTLRVVDESTSNTLGAIVIDDADVVSTDTEIADGIFTQYRSRLTTDRETFELLAEGWSNGYVTIPALTTA